MIINLMAFKNDVAKKVLYTELLNFATESILAIFHDTK